MKKKIIDGQVKPVVMPVEPIKTQFGWIYLLSIPDGTISIETLTEVGIHSNGSVIYDFNKIRLSRSAVEAILPVLAIWIKA
jgi:hypothetical protein